jgi:D-tyrosyl-tRNA(Tyr) deacylase
LRTKDGVFVRAVVQRVKRASVTVDGALVGEIGPGLLVFLGVGSGDTSADAQYLASKIAGLRIFSDAQGKMNLDVQEVGGEILAVSQFTLYGDCRRGAGRASAGRRLPIGPKRSTRSLLRS